MNGSKRKAPKTAFKPGQSGNPDGRPKKTEQELALDTACREKSVAALAVIEALMIEADKDSVRLAAAVFVIERGYGKAVQRQEHTGLNGAPITVDVTVQPMEAYRQMLEGACLRRS